jgi:hypothetical protein
MQEQIRKLAAQFLRKAIDAYQYGEGMPGVAQTASVRSPYIYAEGNWVDDMELAGAAIYRVLNRYGPMGNTIPPECRNLPAGC